MLEFTAIPLFAAATFVLAGFVKGVVGLGLPTVAMALLAVAMPPAEAAALLIVPSAMTNAWQFFVGPSGSRLRLLHRLWPMMLGIAAATGLTAGTLIAGRPGAAAAALGIALCLYALLGLTQVRLTVPARLEPVLSPVAGVATGLVTGATGILAVPSVPYLQALGLGRDDLVQALGLSFTVSTLALAAGLAQGGAFGAANAAASALALLPALIGMAVGQWLRGRIAAETFRRCFFIALFALGLHLAI
ncbi:MAG: sulfite exporter TauE/SafE family protein [Alphaproteobacteria bacterium]